MSTLRDAVLQRSGDIQSMPVRLWKRVRGLPRPLQPPLLALAAVLVNLFLFWLALATGHLYSCFTVAGIVNGAAISVIVVALSSEKLQAGLIGLLGGIWLDNIASQETLARRAIRTAAQFMHGVVSDLQIQVSLPGATQEQALQFVDTAVVYAVWIALASVLASLLVKWVSDVGVARMASRSRVSAVNLVSADRGGV